MIKIESDIDVNEGCYELRIGGEVDASSSIHLETALKEAMSESKRILVDLTELDYISSAGLGVFMSILQDLENEKIDLVIYGMQQKVMEVFDILGLNQLINIKKDKEEALAAIK